MKRFAQGLLAGAALFAAGCASGPQVPPEQRLSELKQATNAEVTSRAQNQENSRLIEEVVESDVLQGLHRHEVAAKLGKGERCGYYPLCAQQGFTDDDWYYDVGVGDEAKVGKHPALIVGFGHYGTVERVYNLTVH